jgi:hypothetical protein
VKLINIISLFFILSLLQACEKSEEDPLLNKPTIFGMGVSISDIPLEHDVQPRLFVEFANPVETPEGEIKNNAHPEFYMPMGAGVSAVSNGRVKSILELDGPDDMLVLVTPDDATQWTIGYEHVSNVTVAVGDQVETGDFIAELSPQDSPFFQGYGKTALMIMVDTGGSSGNFTYCPFLLLDDSVRQSIYDELNTHMQLWEENKGESIFETDQWYSTGCYLEFITNG